MLIYTSVLSRKFMLRVFILGVIRAKKMAEKLASASTCEQQAVIRFLNMGERNKNGIRGKLCKAVYTLVRKLHFVQEPIREHDVCVISTYKWWIREHDVCVISTYKWWIREHGVCVISPYKWWIREQFVANHLHCFFNEHKGCSQFSGYDVRL